MSRILRLFSIVLLLLCTDVLAADKVVVQLKWFHQFQFAGYYAALEKGFYADSGLKVELRERDQEHTPIDNVLSGKAHYGITDTGLVLAALKGKPVVLISQIFQHSPLVLMARQGAQINSIFDLAGKKVTVDSTGITETSILAMMINRLGDLDKVKLQPYNFRYDDLLEGKTDALAGYITNQPFYFKEKGMSIKIIDPRDHGIDFYGDNLFTTHQEASINPGRVEKIRRATLKGWQYALEHPDEIIDLILKKYNTQNMSREHLIYEAEKIKELVLAEYIELGSYEVSRYNKIIATYRQLGLIDNTILPESFYFKNRRFKVQLTSEEEQYLQSLPPLKVPLIEDQPPLSFIRDGRPAGYLNDILTKGAELLGIEIQRISGLSYAASLEALKQNNVDLLNDFSSFGKNRDYLLPTQQVLTTPFVAVGKVTSNDIYGIADLEKKQLVLVKGFQQTRTIETRFPNLDYQKVASIEQAYQLLLTGEADYYIDNASHAGYYLQNSMISDLKVAGTLPRHEMGQLILRFAIDQDKPLLHSAIEKSLASISFQDKQSMRRKWLTSSTKQPDLSLTEAEQQWLLKHPLIRVVMDPDWAPVEYQSESGDYQGMSVDYLKQLETILNVQFKVVPNLTWKQAIDAIRNKTADIFTSVAKTPERETYSIFTSPYVSMPIRMFARNELSYIGSIDKLSGRTVAVAKGYAIHEWLKTEHPELQLVPVNTPAEGLNRVSSGEIDVFIGNVVTANYYINKLDLDNVRTAGDTLYANNQAMAVRNDWPILAGILEKALKSIPQQKHDSIYNRWMSIQFERAIDYRLLWWIILAALLLLAAIFYWNRTLEKKVRNRTQELQENERKYRSLIETTSEGFWMINLARETLDVNKSLCRMLGYTYNEMLGKKIFDFVDAHNRDIFEQQSAQIETTEHRSYEISLLSKASEQIPVIFEATTLKDIQGNIMGAFAFVTNISEQKAMQNRLSESEKRFRSLVESSPVPMLVIDDSPNHNILLMNHRFTDLFGYSIHDVWDVNSWWPKAYPNPDYRQCIQALWQQAIDDMISSNTASIRPVLAEVTCSDGRKCHIETTMTLLSGSGLVVFHDVTKVKLDEELAHLHQQLSELLYKGNLEDIMTASLDSAERLTSSQIGFFHFVETDQETVSLQVWSTRTLKEMCFAIGDGLHYPISEAGVWVDCINERKPIIHNDYASLPHKKGLPEGHAPLLREMTIPIFRNNQIVAVIGVGNKEIDYHKDDIEIITRVADLAYDFVERKQTEQQIKFMAYNDILTGLPNRDLLFDRIKQAISLSRRSNTLLAVCYLDLDGFKPVNDRYGHHIGDILLVSLAQRLSEGLREGDTLARLGGDEFVILLNSLSTVYNGEEIISRILETIKQPFYIEQNRILVSGSIGVTFYPLDNADADTMMRHADQAMYKAKASGKSTYRLYDMVQDQKVHQHRKQLNEFEYALENHQLVLYYQPKVDLGNGEVIGVEALIRWQHPKKGLLSPAAFLGLIEGSPEEIALGEWVLKHALEQHMTWQETQGLKLPVSVNISPRHLQMKGFVEHLTNLLANYPADIADYLELEVLETTAIGDTSEVADIMNECSKLGIHFSLDDFGTGYSSLTYFHRLPIDVLKIDQNFVKDMLDDVRDLDIVEGVLRLAEALKRPVVAEGVETIEVGIMLLQLGCRYAQGYGIARPMPASQIIEWLDKWKNNSIWHKLPAETKGLPEYYDLNVSIFSHRQWLNNILKAFEADDLSQLPELNEDNCQFGRWYNGIGRTRYGSHPSFAFILPKHNQIHRLAKTVSSTYQKGENEKLQSELEQIRKEGEELITLLQKLSQS